LLIIPDPENPVVFTAWMHTTAVMVHPDHQPIRVGFPQAGNAKPSAVSIVDLPTELLHLIAFHLVFVSAYSPHQQSRPGDVVYPHAVIPRRESEGSTSSKTSGRLELPIELPPTAGLTGLSPGPLAEEELLVPHPQAMIPFMLTCRTIHRAIQFGGNERLYQRLYLATFDSDAVLRRYGTGTKVAATPEATKTGTRRERSPRRQTDASTQDKATLWSKGIIPSVQRMESAVIRRSSLGAQMYQSDVSGVSVEGHHSRSMNLLVDPAPLAREYVERWSAIQRIRRCVAEEALEIKGVSTLADVLRDLWTVWWMVIEDGEFATPWAVGSARVW
jgi:hypothetical protein